MVCPHFEHCELLWSPHLREDTYELEKALKAATLMKDVFAVRSEELLLSAEFFSLEQRQPGLW